MSKEFLGDESLFGSIKTDANLIHEGNLVWGSIHEDHGEDDEDDNVVFSLEPSSNNDDSDSDDNEEERNDLFNLTFCGKLKWHWNHHKTKLEHKYAIAAWALCVMEDVRLDVAQQLNDRHGKYNDAIERVVSRLHQTPCANTHPDVPNMSEAEINDAFWNEFKTFCYKTEPFHQPARSLTIDVISGRSHLWHEKYSLPLPYTQVLGYVACWQHPSCVGQDQLRGVGLQ